MTQTAGSYFEGSSPQVVPLKDTGYLVLVATFFLSSCNIMAHYSGPYEIWSTTVDYEGSTATSFYSAELEAATIGTGSSEGDDNDMTECEWRFDAGQQLYTVTPGAGHTGRIDWGDEGWPGAKTPDFCFFIEFKNWSCDVTSQTYLEDEEWKDMSCLGGDIPDDVFVLHYEVNRPSIWSCQRHWFVSWDVTYNATRLEGLVIHLDITCTRRRWRNRRYTRSQCLRFQTEGTPLSYGCYQK
ncbi:uncharacterized protein LOC144872062 [Branchiostoma floridae x Branchiostoma japonicum]